MKTRSTTPLMAHRGDPRGQVLVLFALMLVVLLLVSALAVDYGGWLVTKRNYQNATDAAALAGAQQLTRPLTGTCTNGLGSSKNYCAREAAWESVQAALGLSGLDPVNQATNSSGANSPYKESGYKVWVASPPSDAGSAYPGHVSSSGVVFVRVDHAGMDYLSRIVDTSRTVSAWSTAGRFPANFAVVGMCSTVITQSCLAGDSNIKLDGNNTYLLVNTGDLGTNRWVKSNGNNDGVGLGTDSNAYMQDFDTCWANSTNQCQLYGSTGTAPDTSVTRSAIPLGAAIQDPAYPAPPITSTTTPWQCYPTSVSAPSVALASVLERGLPVVEDPPIQLAAVISPPSGSVALLASTYTVSGTITQTGGANVPNGVTIEIYDSGNNLVGSDTTKNGGYSISKISNGTYTLKATQAGSPPSLMTTTSTSFLVSSANQTVNLNMQFNPIITGTIRDSSSNNALSGVTISITGPGGPYSGTTNASGIYSVIVYYTSNSAFVVNGSLAGYVSNSGNVNANVANPDTTTNVSFNLTPSPASISGTVTDGTSPSSAKRPVPGVTVTLTQSGVAGSQTTTTANDGTYTFGSVLSNKSTTLTLGGSAMTGYVGSSSNPASPYTFTTVGGVNTKDFALWPTGCTSGSNGNWTCNVCGSTTNPTGSNVSCTFTQANAIRPGTYNDITIPANGCAWIDPKGGPSGLDSGQLAGIVHLHGTIKFLGNNAYLFGDGVTIVMDQNTGFNFANTTGFVLNYGSLHNTPSNTASGCNLSSQKFYNDGYTPCFRTVDDTQDYAYAAWTTNGGSPWQSNSGSGCAQASTPVYNTSTAATRCFTPGTDMGITFYAYCPSNNLQCGLGNKSRFQNSGNGFGYLFNGVLYAPGDDVNVGGGSNSQTAAGQIVGWTIEYHGGTTIQQNWYGDPVDGQPFLIEPVLGE